MDRKAVPGAEGRADRTRHGKKKAPPGLRVIERSGHWHLKGTVRAGGSTIRIREGTGLRATPENWDAAERIRLDREREIRDQVVFGIQPTVPFATAADQFLNRSRTRRLNSVDIARIQELTRHFKLTPLREITEAQWNRFIDRRMTGRQPQTRERYLNTVVGFLHWCAERPRQWITNLPHFDRNKEVRRKRAVHRRRVVELTPELIALLIGSASPHLAAQLATEWSTGARVSSILFGVRICDVQLAEGREQIIFQGERTKTGEPVTASLHPFAADVLRRYVEWRGRLRDREKPFFLTHRRVPYIDNPKLSGGHNKTAFVAARRRAVEARRTMGARQAWALRASGQRVPAWEAIDAARTEAQLLAQVTQHWFRHMLATHMLALGADIRSIMDQGGWLDPKSVMIYGHQVPELRRQHVNQLTAPAAQGTQLAHETTPDRKASDPSSG